MIWAIDLRKSVSWWMMLVSNLLFGVESDNIRTHRGQTLATWSPAAMCQKTNFTAVLRKHCEISLSKTWAIQKWCQFKTFDNTAVDRDFGPGQKYVWQHGSMDIYFFFSSELQDELNCYRTTKLKYKPTYKTALANTYDNCGRGCSSMGGPTKVHSGGTCERAVQTVEFWWGLEPVAIQVLSKSDRFHVNARPATKLSKSCWVQTLNVKQKLCDQFFALRQNRELTPWLDSVPQPQMSSLGTLTICIQPFLRPSVLDLAQRLRSTGKAWGCSQVLEKWASQQEWRVLSRSPKVC